MYRIDAADNAAALPTPAAPGPNPDGYFRTPVPGSVKGTVVHEDWGNAVQEELALAVEDAGLSLDKADQNQLTEAIKSLGTPRGYWWGGTFTRTAARTFDVSAGTWKSTNDLRRLHWTGAISVDLDTTGAGGRGGSLPTSDWFHVFAIENDTTLAIDVYAEADSVAANIPAGHSNPRKLFSILLDGSSNIVDMFNIGDRFLWKNPPLDVAVTEDATANTRALTVPPDFRSNALLNLSIDCSSNYEALYVSSLDVDDEIPAEALAPLGSVGGSAETGEGNRTHQNYAEVLTNTSQQVRTRATSSLPIQIATLGWVEQRGV